MPSATLGRGTSARPLQAFFGRGEGSPLGPRGTALGKWVGLLGRWVAAWAPTRSCEQGYFEPAGMPLEQSRAASYMTPTRSSSMAGSAAAAAAPSSERTSAAKTSRVSTPEEGCAAAKAERSRCPCAACSISHAWDTWGCRLDGMRLQPRVHTVAAEESTRLQPGYKGTRGGSAPR